MLNHLQSDAIAVQNGLRGVKYLKNLGIFETVARCDRRCAHMCEDVTDAKLVATADIGGGGMV